MSKPMLNGMVALVAVFFFFASSFALFWLLSPSARPSDFLPHIGFVCAVYCAMGSLILSWSVSFAYLARQRNWSPRTCLKVGWPLAAAGFLLVFFFFADAPRLSFFGSMLACSATFGGYITRRLVYPELTDEEAISQKPLTLFPK